MEKKIEDYTLNQCEGSISLLNGLCDRCGMPSLSSSNKCIRMVELVSDPSKWYLSAPESICVSCDQKKVTHELCLDCAVKLGRDNPSKQEEIQSELLTKQQTIDEQAKRITELEEENKRLKEDDEIWSKHSLRRRVLGI